MYSDSSGCGSSSNDERENNDEERRIGFGGSSVITCEDATDSESESKASSLSRRAERRGIFPVSLDTMFLLKGVLVKFYINLAQAIVGFAHHKLNLLQFKGCTGKFVSEVLF